QHGLEIEGGVDRLADLAKRLQLFDRLREFAGARLHLVEQPHVLDRDHRLVGEGGEQLDLSVGERAHQTSRQDAHADRRSFAHERHANQGVNSADLGIASWYSGSVRASGMWIAVRSSSARPPALPRPALMGVRSMYSLRAGEKP